MNFVDQPYLSRRSDELYHHGIKGQKWGVRRYQNEDGTLTAVGRLKYGKSVEKGMKLLDQGKYPSKIARDTAKKVAIQAIIAAASATVFSVAAPVAVAAELYSGVLWIGAMKIPLTALPGLTMIGSAVSTSVAATKGVASLVKGVKDMRDAHNAIPVYDKTHK